MTNRTPSTLERTPVGKTTSKYPSVVICGRGLKRGRDEEARYLFGANGGVKNSPDTTTGTSGVTREPLCEKSQPQTLSVSSLKSKRPYSILNYSVTCWRHFLVSLKVAGSGNYIIIEFIDCSILYALVCQTSH